MYACPQTLRTLGDVHKVNWINTCSINSNPSYPWSMKWSEPYENTETRWSGTLLQVVEWFPTMPTNYA